MGEWIRRLRYLLQRRRLEEELAGEMEFHREMAARNGGAPFGNTLRLREEAREAWGWMWMERLGQDLRYAGRQLRRSPGFTAMAILMLAIGIGANVGAFGFLNLMMLRPLRVRSPETLLRFKRRSPGSYASQMPYPEMAFFRRYTKTLAAGVGGAAALSQLLRRELYGIGSLDPVAYLGAMGVFMVMVTVAALLPARRALRVDPLRSLRYE